MGWEMQGKEGSELWASNSGFAPTIYHPSVHYLRFTIHHLPFTIQFWVDK